MKLGKVLAGKKDGQRLYTIESGATIRAAAKKIVSLKTGYLMVRAKDVEPAEFIGIITKYDIIKSLCFDNSDPDKDKVDDFMTRKMIVANVMRRSSGFSYPRLAVKLPCGSASISNTFLPSLASPMPTFTVVVVFPTPPFWFTTDITLHMISSSFNFPMILFSIISTVPVFPVSSLPVYKNLENTCATARL